MGGILQRMLESFYSKSLECVVIGLENAGKTSILNVIANGAPTETVPTVGLSVRRVKCGGVEMKTWDIGGQAQYRGEWQRYCRGADVIVFVVDSSDMDRLPTARVELHRLLEDTELATTPILVLANKIDLEPHVSEPELIRELNLDYISAQPWIVIPCSALRVTNIDQVVQWLSKQAK